MFIKPINSRMIKNHPETGFAEMGAYATFDEPSLHTTGLVARNNFRFARDSGRMSSVLPIGRNCEARRKHLPSARSCFPADSYCMARLLSAIVLACRSGFKRRVEFLELNGSWTSFVDDVERCFRSSPETAEAGCGGHLANPLFAGLRAQAQRDFLRTRTGRAQQS